MSNGNVNWDFQMGMSIGNFNFENAKWEMSNGKMSNDNSVKCSSEYRPPNISPPLIFF